MATPDVPDHGVHHARSIACELTRLRRRRGATEAARVDPGCRSANKGDSFFFLIFQESGSNATQQAEWPAVPL